ncbi:MAG: aspartate ammonia-lyase [Bacteroidetes bacterium]|nr:aspartate ammonia-lyase [Bacteroidota bacterium]
MTEKEMKENGLSNNEVLYGLYTERYVKNFGTSDVRVNPHLIKAYFQVKLAAAETNYKSGKLFQEKYEAIEEAIDELIDEVNQTLLQKSYSIYDKIVVDAYQGGTGTYLNMNINEVIARTALKNLGKNNDDYSTIHPIEDVNMSQSTNDTYPTAVKIATIHLLKELSNSFMWLVKSLRQKEKDFASVLKLGRTQLQDAVPISLGQSFQAYADAIQRIIDQIKNCEEQLTEVNLGGTAIGNSIAAPKEYTKHVITELRKKTGLDLKPAKNLIDNTQNLDVFVGVSGVLKTASVILIKMANDLRLMASGPMGGFGEIKLPEQYSVSSFIPGKSNPAVLENTIQIAELIKGHDVVVSNLVAAGNLELNSFLPMISHILLKSIELLRNTNYRLSENCIKLIEANRDKCRETLLKTSAIAPSLVNTYGLQTISEIVQYANENQIPFLKALLKSNLVTEDELFQILSKELSINLE